MALSGIKVIRSFARENENIADFRSINTEYHTQTRTFYRLTAHFRQGVATVSVLGQALVLLGGGILPAAGSLTLGTIAAFLLYRCGRIIPEISKQPIKGTILV